MNPTNRLDGSVHAAIIPFQYAEDARVRLESEGLIDRRTKIAKRDGHVVIPLLGAPRFDLDSFGGRVESVDGLVLRTSRSSPGERIRARLAAEGLPPDGAPRRWKRLGDIAIVRIPPRGRAHAIAIAEIIGTELGVRTVVEDVSGVHGPLRVPDVRVLWGGGTETVHVEGGIRYALDVARVMFSSGNTAERTAIAARVRPGATVVDLFAGIGYFTLPIALHGRPRGVIACELNPVSYEYLVRNVEANRASNVVTRQGNCRDVAPRGVADLVVMGHFDSRGYLDLAFECLRAKGTVILHDLCAKEQYPGAFARRTAAVARAHWRDVDGMRTRIVKSYAPGIVHAVAEVDVSAQMRRR